MTKDQFSKSSTEDENTAHSGSPRTPCGNFLHVEFCQRVKYGGGKCFPSQLARNFSSFLTLSLCNEAKRKILLSWLSRDVPLKRSHFKYFKEKVARTNKGVGAGPGKVFILQVPRRKTCSSF
jgi:hypothetical protein